MKRILTLIAAFSILLTACEGDQGPPGFDGLNADEFAAQSFETTVDFQFSNETLLQEVNFLLPERIFDTDAVLVFRFEGTTEINGEILDIWSPLPQNFFLEDNDIIQYIFNHTVEDIQLLIDGNFDLSTLSSDFTDNQTFRIITLPAESLNGIDVSNMNTVMEALNIENFQSL